MSRRERILRRPLAGGAPMLLGLFLLGTSQLRAAEPLPDPTRPAATSRQPAATTAKDANEKLELLAIFHADERRFAVVNGRRVMTGDRIADAEVLSIGIDHVRLRRDGELVRLELVAPAFKNARQAHLSSPSPGAPDPESATPVHPRGALR